MQRLLDSARPLLIATALWFVAGLVDVLRRARWLTVTRQPVEWAERVAIEGVMLAPWWAMSCALIVYAAARNGNALATPRAWAVMAALVTAITLLHPLALGAAHIALGTPGASETGLAGLYHDVLLNSLRFDMFAGMLTGVCLAAYTRHLRESHALPEPAVKYRNMFRVRMSQRDEVLPAERVERIVADGNYVELHVDGRMHLARENIGALEKSLDPKQFVRVHRSAIVNRDRILTLERDRSGWKVLMASGAQVPVSRRRVAPVRAVLGLTRN